MPRASAFYNGVFTDKEQEMLIVFAAECEAVAIIADMLNNPTIKDQIPGNNWRERIENFGWDVRQFGARYTAENSGLLYDFS